MPANFSTLDQTARLSIEIVPHVRTMVSTRAFDDLAKASSRFNTQQVTQAKLLADAQVREAQRASKALIAEQEKQVRLSKQLADAQLRQDQAAANGRVFAYKRATDQIIALNDRLKLSNDSVAAAQKRANDALSGVGPAKAAAASAERSAAIGTLVRGASTGLIGAGALGIGAGILTGRSAMNWQTYASQQLANSPMTKQMAAYFQNLALQWGPQYGATPESLLLGARYGSELLGPIAGGNLKGMDTSVLRAAMMLGLPTGGSAAVAPSVQAIGTVMRNFKGAGSPNAIANMILAASQNSAGVNASDFVGAIPEVLGIAGHIGGSDQLQQSLAIIAALTSAGMDLGTAQTQAKNLITRIFKPSPATQKYIANFDRLNNTNLAGDFGQQALQTKGLAGVISDIHGMGLNASQLAYLFPNMRGYVGALGLTGNQNASFLNILGRINQSPQNNPIGTNFARYMKLPTTQVHEFEQQIHTLAITMGQSLLPDFNTLMKNDLIPGAKAVSAFTTENKDLIDKMITLSPLLLAVGGGIKLIIAGAKGYVELKELATALGLVGKNAEISAELSADATAMETLSKKAAFSSALNDDAAAMKAVNAQAEAGLTPLGKWGNLLYSISLVASGLAIAAGEATIMKGVEKARGMVPAPAMPGLMNKDHVTSNIYPGYVWTAGQWKNVSNATSASQREKDAQNWVRTHGGPWGLDSAHDPTNVGGAGSLATYSLPSGRSWTNVRPSASTFGLSNTGNGAYFQAGPLNQGYTAPQFTATGHWDFHANSGNVSLPPGGTWYIKFVFSSDKWGGEVMIGTPNGGNIDIIHLWPNSINKTLRQGKTIKSSGRLYIGQIGWTGPDAATPHAHVAVDAKAEAYLYQLTHGKNWVTETPASGTSYTGDQTGSPVQPVVSTGSWGTSGGGSTWSSKSPTVPGITSNTILNALNRQEGGTYGLGPAYGSIAQRRGYAAKTLQYWYNWTGTPAGRAAMKAHGFNPDSPLDREKVTLAIYNTGESGPWWKKYYSSASDVNSLHPSATESAATPDARGMQYAMQVLGYAGIGSGSGTTTGGGTTTHKKYVNPSASNAPLTVADAQKVLSSPAFDKYRNKDGSLNFAAMPPQLRAAADAMIRAIATGNLGPLGNSLNMAVAAHAISQAQGNAIYQSAASRDTYSQQHPEIWYNSHHAGKTKTPAQWASYWSAKEAHDKKLLSELLKPYTDSNGVIHWDKMSPKYRASVDSLIRQIGGEDFMANRGTANADIKNKQDRATILGFDWSGPNNPLSRMAAYSHPEAYWNSVLGNKSTAGGASAAAQAWYVIGRNCEAAQHALPVQKLTAKGIGQMVGQAAAQTKLLGQAVNLLAGIHKNTGGKRGSLGYGAAAGAIAIGAAASRSIGASTMSLPSQ